MNKWIQLTLPNVEKFLHPHLPIKCDVCKIDNANFMAFFNDDIKPICHECWERMTLKNLVLYFR